MGDVPDRWQRAVTTQLCVWLQVSVLLRYLADKGGAAGWHLTSQQMSALQHELQPQVCAHCSAHVTRGTPSILRPADENLRLLFLHSPTLTCLR